MLDEFCQKLGWLARAQSGPDVGVIVAISALCGTVAAKIQRDRNFDSLNAILKERGMPVDPNLILDCMVLKTLGLAGQCAPGLYKQMIKNMILSFLMAFLLLLLGLLLFALEAHSLID